jgi:hypothetical protein
MRRLVSLAALTCCTVSTAARAESGFSLEWTGTEDCAQRSAVLSRLEYLLGGPPEASPPIEARARVERRKSDNWRLRLAIRQGADRRERVLEAQTCGALAEATALIVALAISPESERVQEALASSPEQDGGIGVELDPPSEPRTPQERRTPAPVMRRSLPPDRATHPAPSTGSPLRVRVASGIDTGLLPAVAFGAAAGAVLALDGWRFELVGTYWFERRARRDDAPEKGADIAAITGTLTTCALLLRAPIAAGPCAGVEGGGLFGSGFGVTEPESGVAPWLAATAGGVVAFPLLAEADLAIRADLVAAPARARFVLDNVGPVHRPSAISARLGAGLDVRFW